MDHFQINKNTSIFCRSEETRYGFRHLATLYVNNQSVAKTKACYYNRTWESYEYQSVVDRLIDSNFPHPKALRYKKRMLEKATGHINRHFAQVATIAKLGSILTDKPAEANDFKKRIISTLPGIDIPQDFDALPDTEKEKRLDAVIDVLENPIA